MKLTAQNVKITVLACLFTNDEPQEPNLEVRAVQLWVKFHPGRVALQRANIASMLAQLPASFRDDHIAGGASFLLSGERADGTPWGEHRDIDSLLALGLAIDRVQLVDRRLWPALAGGMPYLTITVPPIPAA